MSYKKQKVTPGTRRIMRRPLRSGLADESPPPPVVTGNEGHATGCSKLSHMRIHTRRLMSNCMTVDDRKARRHNGRLMLINSTVIVVVCFVNYEKIKNTWTMGRFASLSRVVGTMMMTFMRV